MSPATISLDLRLPDGWVARIKFSSDACAACNDGDNGLSLGNMADAAG
jgi:hypothetical protein